MTYSGYVILFYFQQGLTDQCQMQVRLILKQNSLSNTPLILVTPVLLQLIILFFLFVWFFFS